MKLSSFNFNLPKELLAEYPSETRDEARLMVVDRKTGKIEHRLFKDVIDILMTEMYLFSIIQKYSLLACMDIKKKPMPK